MRTDISIKSQDTAGNSSTNKISYVNPNASDAQLSGFVEKLNSLTNNTIQTASKITTTEISTATKQVPEDSMILLPSSKSIELTNETSTVSIDATFNDWQPNTPGTMSTNYPGIIVLQPDTTLTGFAIAPYYVTAEDGYREYDIGITQGARAGIISLKVIGENGYPNFDVKINVTGS